MKYAWLQCKKLIRILPFTVIIILIFLLIASLVFSTAADFVNNEQAARFKADIVGESDSQFFNTGLTALKALDSSNVSITWEKADEETARNDLLTGRVAAYVVIPEGFMEAAGRGEILPITYYTTASTVDVSALMREEITEAISTVLKYSQKGIFGEEQLLLDHGYRSIVAEEVDELNYEYVGFILGRDQMYQTEITGESHGLNGVQHLFLGMLIVMLCIAMIPISCLHMRRDNSMLKMIASSGKGAAYSALAEYGAMLAVLLSGVLIVIASVAVLARFMDLSGFLRVGVNLKAAAICVFPIAVMICAFAFLIFEAAGNLISAVTGYFFCTFGLCYISGCMYPVYALPRILQTIASFTPTGVAREYLFLSVTGGNAIGSLIGVFLYAAGFLALSVFLRRFQLSKGEG